MLNKKKNSLVLEIRCSYGLQADLIPLSLMEVDSRFKLALLPCTDLFDFILV